MARIHIHLALASESPVDVPPGSAAAQARDAAVRCAGLDAGASFPDQHRGAAAGTRTSSAGPDDLVVGGSFTHIGALAAARIARWDGALWSQLGDGVPGQVTAIGRDGATVYVSSYDEGAGAFLLASFPLDGHGDAATWTELATPAAGLTPQPYFDFNAIAVGDGAVLAAGSATLDDGSGRGALLYQDEHFRPVGGGVRGMTISDLALTGDAVWFAGQIAEAGASPTLIPTIGLARRAVSR